jgi:signal transduction histidine kinase
MAWRRRGIGPGTGLLSAFSNMATGPAHVAYLSLCTHHRTWRLLPLGVVAFLCPPAQAVAMGPDRQSLSLVVTKSVIAGGLTVIGLYLRGRRDLAASRRAAALVSQSLRVERTRLAERARIAHEMHDVLAHRISSLSLLASGLTGREDLGAEETRRVAPAIQENAHRSLNELRAVLGTLRREGVPGAPRPDQTTFRYDESTDAQPREGRTP